LLDRLDLHVKVPALRYEELRSVGSCEPSATVRDRVQEARSRQESRLAGRGLWRNAQMGAAELQEFCRVDEASHALLERVVDRLGMSARAVARIRKVARTIADLAGSESLSVEHVAEAARYRQLDRAPGR